MLDVMKTKALTQFTFAILFLCLNHASAQSPDVKFTIDEEMTPPKQIGAITLSPELFPGSSPEDRRSFQYGILDQSSVPGSLFNITRSEGVVYVARRIDREKLCLGLSDCTLNMNVLINPPVPSQFESQVISVSITVNDINDNPPSFRENTVTLKVSEGNAPNDVLKISGANDLDYRKDFKVRNYTLNGYRDTFELTTSRALDGSSEIDLRLLKSLDRERKDKYQFTITAFDGGNPSLSAVLFVVIDVTDKNDNAPIFLNDSYSVNVDSTTEIKTVILRVSAVDEDEGENSEIIYDFSGLQKFALENTLYINTTTGDISIIGPLKPGRIHFIVEAQDSASSPLKSQTEVVINVLSSGNAPPDVAIKTLGAGTQDNTISILEPGGRGMFVALVDMNDDGGRESVTCSISNDVFRMEAIPNKGYKISLQGFVDRETRSAYNLSVTCIDQGNPPMNTTQHFLVKIDDDNDNAPIFTQKQYSRTFTEGKKIGEFVLQVSASDRDAGDNSKIRYSIDQNFALMFKIDSTTGVVSAIGDLDREKTPVINFSAYATDGGKTPQKTSVQVSVILEDVNDNDPEFAEKVFHFHAREEVLGQRIINTLVAKDADEGLNGKLEYFYTGSMDGADGSFTVMTNGSIVSAGPLDREKRANYTFSVMVRDRGNPPRAASASVLIEIDDINDNAPDILFPKSKNHTILISTVPETGVILSRVIAYDDDDGDNGSLRFTIVSGNEDRAFEIDDTTGELTIAEASRLKNRKLYHVSIVVADRGSPPKINTTALRIDVYFDNSTMLREGKKEKEEDYIIIVAVVAAITVVFSTFIIVAICIVFHKDRLSRQKPSMPKTGFSTLQKSSPGKHSSNQKINSMNGDNVFDTHSSNSKVNHHHSQNHPGSRSGSDSQNSDSGFGSGPYYQESFSLSDCPNSSKGKAVSFSVLDSEKNISGIARASTPRRSIQNPPPPPPHLSTFDSSAGSGLGHRVGPMEDGLFHQRLLMSRQVSGAKYAPVSTSVHVGTPLFFQTLVIEVYNYKYSFLIH